MLFIVKRPIMYISNIIKVLFGVKTFVGYYYNDINISKFPLLKKGILNPTDMFSDKELNNETLYKLNLLYLH